MSRRPTRALLLCLILACVVTGPARAIDESCAVMTTCSTPDIEAIPTVTYANLNWLMQFTPSGYADFTIFTLPPFPRWDPRNPSGPSPLHEMYSGEFAVAIDYDGHGPMYLEKCFRYPESDTWSTFVNIQPPVFDTDTDADGINEGTSVVENDHLRVTVNYDMNLESEGAAMGLGAFVGADYTISDRFSLTVRYEFENITATPINDFSVYKYDHTHPANNETGSGIQLHFDWDQHLMGSNQNYRYDATAFSTNSGLTDGFSTGSTWTDHVGVQSTIMPDGYGLGTHAGHGNGNPSPSLFCTIKNGSALGSEMSITTGELASAMRWDLGTIDPGQTKSVDFLFTVASENQGLPYEGCLRINEIAPGQQPEIHIEKGLCVGQNPTVGAYDVVKGSLYELSHVPGCSPSFDCTQLRNLVCLENNFSFDRFSMTYDAHVTDALYFLGRPAGRFTSYGMGSQPSGFPVNRFFFTPSTIPDVDVVDACIYSSSLIDEERPHAPVPTTPQHKFTWDVDTWANEMHQMLLDRAKEPTP